MISLSLMCQFEESFTTVVVCFSSKPLVSCVPVVLRMSERVIGLPVVLCGFKKLLSSLENRQQPVKTWERWRCQMLLCPLQHWSVNKSHRYQTTKQFLNVENLELAENQTNNFLHSFINTCSCEVFCAPPRPPSYPIYRYCWPHRPLTCQPLTSALAFIRLSVINMYNICLLSPQSSISAISRRVPSISGWSCSRFLPVGWGQGHRL